MRAQTGFLNGIDKITLVYCLWILAYMVAGIFLGRAVDWEIHLPRYLSVATGVFVLAWLENCVNWNRFPLAKQGLHFVRGVYPVMLFGYFYTSSYSVNRILFPEFLDPFFMKIDHLMFGYYPSLEWGQRFGGWLAQEFFHFAYFCYYPMIGGLPLYLYLKNRPAFWKLIFNLTFVFYACYTFYSLVPVVGGRFIPEAHELTLQYRFGPFTHIMAYIYNNSGHWGGAFPSSHIAVTIVLTIAALKYVRKWGYVFIVISVFLSLATVYCHYHWFIDAIGGVLAGIGGWRLAERVRPLLQREI